MAAEARTRDNTERKLVTDVTPWADVKAATHIILIFI